MKKNIIGIFSLLVVIFIITAIINPKFLNAYNMQNLIKWSSLYAVMSIGVAIVIITIGRLWNPDQQALLQVEGDITQRYPVFALGATPPGQGDQSRKLAVGTPIRGQGNDLDAFLQL